MKSKTPKNAKRTTTTNNSSKQIASLARRVSALETKPHKKREQTTLGSIGEFAGNTVSKIFGLGAYSIRQNSLYDSHTQSQVPFMHSTDESITLKHREYITDISSTTTFTATSYAINPGMLSTFPYLSSIAGNFQEYKFQGLNFEFKSTSANALNSTNTALGYVALACQYRSDATTPATKTELMNITWSEDGKPSNDILLPVECKPTENAMPIQYVRQGSLPSNSDIKMFDLGKLVVATGGSQAAAVVGELWATYEIKLYKPIITPSTLNSYLDYAHYVCTGCTGAVPMGTAQTRKAGDQTLTFSLGASSHAVSFYPTDRYYMVEAFWVGTSVAITTPTVAVTNGTKYLCWTNTTLTEVSTAGTQIACVYQLVVSVTDLTTAVSLGWGLAGTLPGTAVCDYIVTGLGNNYA